MLKGEHLERATYTFLHTLDEGNVATCILTFHSIFNREVVQKTVSMLAVPDGVAHEPTVLKDVQHDRIVEVWEAQWDPDRALKGMQAITFVCPYYEGGSIYTALMEEHLFSVHDAIRIADDVLCALDYLHATKYYVHRDVKPANIMLDVDRKRAFLGDLGSAARIGQVGGSAEAHGGSALYLAPEARPSGYVTSRADLYSLGVTLVELLNGRFLYENLDGCEIDDRLDAGRRAMPDKDIQPAPWVPLAFASFLRSLCAVKMSDRPQDAATALRALRKIRVVDWRRTSGDGLYGSWVGYWPPENRRDQQRQYEVRSERVKSGQQTGRVLVTVRWRRPNGGWRNMPRLRNYIAPTDSEMRAFFRLVEAQAHSAPAP